MRVLTSLSSQTITSLVELRAPFINLFFFKENLTEVEVFVESKFVGSESWGAVGGGYAIGFGDGGASLFAGCFLLIIVVRAKSRFEGSAIILIVLLMLL